MKLTRHNGRSGKHGTYNPRHNDRRFDVENSEHIDAQRAKKNVYWDCYRGFTTPEFRENPEQPDFSFEEIERMYYYEHYSDHVDAQNARNEKTRHTERNRSRSILGHFAGHFPTFSLHLNAKKILKFIYKWRKKWPTGQQGNFDGFSIDICGFGAEVCPNPQSSSSKTDGGVLYWQCDTVSYIY